MTMRSKSKLVAFLTAFVMFFASVLAIPTIALADPGDAATAEYTYETEYAQPEAVMPVLATPVVTFGDSLLSWAVIEGAVSYTVFAFESATATEPVAIAANITPELGAYEVIFNVETGWFYPALVSGPYYFRVQAIADYLEAYDSPLTYAKGPFSVAVPAQCAPVQAIRTIPTRTGGFSWNPIASAPSYFSN